MKLVRKIKKKLPALRLMLKALWLNTVVREKRQFNPESKVHISLTSYGSRLRKVFMTIEMLFLQRADISSITLYISNQDMQREQLPKSLKGLEARGLNICFVDENIRSYKKIFYSYLKHSEAQDHEVLLVTADDDVLYSDNWLEELVDAHKKHPNSVVAHRCHTITLDEEGNPKPYRQWNGQHQCSLQDISDNLFMPTGIGGVLYPIASLTGLEHQKEAFMDKCASADDVWLKCLTYYNGFYSVPTVPKCPVTFPDTLSFNTKRRGLAMYNVHQGGNDVQMSQAVEYFKLKFSHQVEE